MKRLILILLLLATASGCILNLDITPPVITSVSTSVIKYSSVTITWITDEAATSLVEYGTTTKYGSDSGLIEVLEKDHAVDLTALNPDTTYHYRVRSRDSSGNETISEDGTFNTTEWEFGSIEYEWEFMNKDWKYSTEITESDYDYFADKPRAHDYAEYVLNDADDDWMKSLADLFIENADKEGWGESYYVPFALAFVQSFSYTSDEVTTGYNEYPRYPIETIVVGGGDCEDTSILFASIVREMGYGVALLLLEEDEHMAVGVQITQSFLESWDAAAEGYECAYYTASDGKMYAYCETTSEGWEIGERSDELVGTAEIIDVSGQ